jgi:hypothetical protein
MERRRPVNTLVPVYQSTRRQFPEYGDWPVFTKFHMVALRLLRSYQRINLGPKHVSVFRNYARFYGEELLAPRPNPRLEDHPLSAARDCLFNIFTAILHIGGRFSILNLRTRHAVVTGTHFRGA